MSDFLNTYNSTKEIFEKNIEKYLESFNHFKKLDDAMKYSLNAGGKRLRPVLMIECAKILGLPEKRIMPFAVAIEMIHTYSLIHDDLPCMDNDSLRRGKPTNHVVFGEDMAVLAGDGLLNTAFEIILENIEEDNFVNYFAAVRHLFSSSGAKGMVGGQAIDVENTGNFQDIESLELMHSKKTGALFMSACLCPALLLGANDDIMSCLRDFAVNIGLLFQVKDDILDVIGDQDKMGKTLGKDAQNNKSTFISLMGLEQSISYAQHLAEKAQEPLKYFGSKSIFLAELTKYFLERTN